MTTYVMKHLFNQGVSVNSVAWAVSKFNPLAPKFSFKF